MVRVVAIVALVVWSGVAQAGEARSRKAEPSLLDTLRVWIGVKPTRTALRPPGRIAAGKPASAPKPVSQKPVYRAATTAAAPAVAGAALASAAAPVPAKPPAEPLRPCSGQRVMSAFYSQGSYTASGEPFDPEALTAAHRHLPFGTRVTVTNPLNGRSVTVTVNDRGPFVTGVTLDLSAGAARAIGMSRAQVLCMS